MVLPVHSKLRNGESVEDSPKKTLSKTQKRNLRKYRSVKMQKIENKALKVAVETEKVGVIEETHEFYHYELVDDDLIPTTHRQVEVSRDVKDARLAKRAEQARKIRGQFVQNVQAYEKKTKSATKDFTGHVVEENRSLKSANTRLQHENKNLKNENMKLKRKNSNILSQLTRSAASNSKRRQSVRENSRSLRKAKLNVYNFNRGVYGTISALSVANLGLKAASVFALRRLYMSYCRVQITIPRSTVVNDLDILKVRDNWERRPIDAFVVYIYMYYYHTVCDKVVPNYMRFHDYLINSQKVRNHVFNNYTNYDLSYSWSQLYDSDLLVIVEYLTKKIGTLAFAWPGTLLGYLAYRQKLASMFDWRILLNLVPFGNLVYELYCTATNTVEAIYDIRTISDSEFDFLDRQITGQLRLDSDRLHLTHRPYNPNLDLGVKKPHVHYYRETIASGIQQEGSLVTQVPVHHKHDGMGDELAHLLLGEPVTNVTVSGISDLSNYSSLEELKDMIKSLQLKTTDTTVVKAEDVFEFIGDPSVMNQLADQVGGSFNLQSLISWFTDISLGGNDIVKSWNQDFLYEYDEQYQLDNGGLWGTYWRCKLCGKYIYTAKGPARRNAMDNHATGYVGGKKSCPYDWRKELVAIAKEFVGKLRRGETNYIIE